MGQALRSYFRSDPQIYCYARIAWGGKNIHFAVTPKHDLHNDNAGWIFICQCTPKLSRVALSLLDAEKITARFVHERKVELNQDQEHMIVFDLDQDPCLHAVVFEMITTTEDQTTNKVVTLRRDVNGWYV